MAKTILTPVAFWADILSSFGIIRFLFACVISLATFQRMLNSMELVSYSQVANTCNSKNESITHLTYTGVRLPLGQYTFGDPHLLSVGLVLASPHQCPSIQASVQSSLVSRSLSPYLPPGHLYLTPNIICMKRIRDMRF